MASTKARLVVEPGERLVQRLLIFEGDGFSFRWSWSSRPLDFAHLDTLQVEQVKIWRRASSLGPEMVLFDQATSIGKHLLSSCNVEFGTFIFLSTSFNLGRDILVGQLR